MAFLTDTRVAFGDDEALRGFATSVLRSRSPGAAVDADARVEAATGFTGGEDEARAELNRLLAHAMAQAGVDPQRYDVVFFTARTETPPTMVWCMAAMPRMGAPVSPPGTGAPGSRFGGEDRAPEVTVTCFKCKHQASVQADTRRFVCTNCGAITRWLTCTSCHKTSSIWAKEDGDIWSFTCPKCGSHQRFRIASPEAAPAKEPPGRPEPDPGARRVEITARLQELERQLTELRSRIEQAMTATSNAPGAQVLIASVEEKLGHAPAPGTPTLGQVHALEKERDELQAELAGMEQGTTPRDGAAPNPPPPAAAPAAAGGTAMFSAEDLRGYQLNREALERKNWTVVHAHYPQLNHDQLEEVRRRVAVMVHESAKGMVPDDVAYVMLAADGLDEKGYLAQAEALLNEIAASPVLAESVPPPPAPAAPMESAGGSLVGGSGRDLENLIGELISIGRNAGGYVGTPDDVVFDEDHDHIRTRQIGELLDQLGGMELMLIVHDRVRQELGPIRARELEACWGGVGHWMR